MRYKDEIHLDFALRETKYCVYKGLKELEV